MSAPKPVVHQDEDGEWRLENGRRASWVDMEAAGYKIKTRELARHEKKRPGDVVHFIHDGNVVRDVRYKRSEWVKEA